MNGYDYVDFAGWVLTDEGQRVLFRVMDHARALCQRAGAVTMGKLLSEEVPEAPSTWNVMAAVDRLVELQQLYEVTAPAAVAGQDRVFRLLRREA